MNILKCGNSYELIKQLPDNSVDCIYTDIPYLLTTTTAKDDNVSSLCKRIYKTNQKDLKEIQNGINMEILDEFVRVMKKINCFIWCSKLQLHDIMEYFKNKDCNFEILFWGKTNPTPSTNNKWLPDTEYCLYFREKGVKLNDGYQLKRKWHISPLNTKDKKKYNHPTIKPLDLTERHILHATQEGDIVLDPFCGSGTTLVASKNTNRKYIGFDINEEYIETCKKRLEE